jgi:hypothetical protein
MSLPPPEERGIPVLAEQKKRLRALADEMHATQQQLKLGPRYAENIQRVETAVDDIEAIIADLTAS